MQRRMSYIVSTSAVSDSGCRVTGTTARPPLSAPVTFDLHDAEFPASQCSLVSYELDAGWCDEV